jgi:hypothetical protein
MFSLNVEVAPGMSLKDLSLLLVNLQGLHGHVTPMAEELETAIKQFEACSETTLWKDHFTDVHDERGANWQNYFRTLTEFEAFNGKWIKLEAAIRRTCYAYSGTREDLITIYESTMDNEWLVTFLTICPSELSPLHSCKFYNYDNGSRKWKAVQDDRVFFVRRDVQLALTEMLDKAKHVNSLMTYNHEMWSGYQ